MSPLTTSLIAFACIFGGSLLGLFLRGALPADHLSADSRNTVKMGMGLVGTMTALVLGLLVASAKTSYDAQSAALVQESSDVILLDRVLAHYGPETHEARETLKESVAAVIAGLWGEDRGGQSGAPSTANESLYDKITSLSPKNGAQGLLKSQALSIVTGLAHTRWLMYEQGIGSVSNPFVAAMILWLTITFVSWGLFAPSNGTVIANFVVAASSVSGAIFLILEMYKPFSGLIRISRAPLQSAFDHLGK
jgi:hypothetical protein